MMNLEVRRCEQCQSYVWSESKTCPNCNEKTDLGIERCHLKPVAFLFLMLGVLVSKLFLGE